MHKTTETLPGVLYISPDIFSKKVDQIPGIVHEKRLMNYFGGYNYYLKRG